MYEQQRHHDNATRTTVAEVIGQIAMGAIVGLIFAWVLINWISGCGEIIYTATGTMQGECILMPWVKP
jgi:NhaP-type Na+/H+ or K+/H+ antiporter